MLIKHDFVLEIRMARGGREWHFSKSFLEAGIEEISNYINLSLSFSVCVASILSNNSLDRHLSFYTLVFVMLPHNDWAFERFEHAMDLVPRRFRQGGPLGFYRFLRNVPNARLQISKSISRLSFPGTVSIFGVPPFLRGGWHLLGISNKTRELDPRLR